MKFFDKLDFPTVGMRMVKSSIVVFLCLVLSLLRQYQNISLDIVIAAFLCIQPTMESSKEVAVGRLFGTLIGGFWGSIVLAVNIYLLSQVHVIFVYLLISIMIIPVIYTGVAFKKPSSVFIACVVFLSITVNNIGNVSLIVFVFNRMLDTFLGVLIAMAVNHFYMPKGNAT